MLVNNGSFVDIIFHDAFKKMVKDPKQICPTHILLKGFSSQALLLIDAITLPVIMSKVPYAATMMMSFLVVRAYSSYNVILGQPKLNRLKAITFTYHLKINFSIEAKIRESKERKSSYENVMCRN